MTGAVYAVVCNNQTYIKRGLSRGEWIASGLYQSKYKDIFISYEEDPSDC